MLLLQAIERNGETGKIAKGRLLQLSGTRATLLSSEGNVVRQGLYRHWGESFILSTTDDTRAVIVKFKAFKRKVVDLEFNSAEARQHAVHAWYHLWTSASNRNATLIKISHQTSKPASLLTGQEAMRDDSRRMASKAGQKQTARSDSGNRNIMPQATGGFMPANKAIYNEYDAKPINRKLASLATNCFRRHI